MFPVNAIDIQIMQPELIPIYAEVNPEDLPAVWYSIGRKLKDGTIILHWDRKVKVMDGFHRTAAAKQRGDNLIRAIMPESHWLFFQKLKVIKYELCNKNQE